VTEMRVETTVFLKNNRVQCSRLALDESVPKFGEKPFDIYNIERFFVEFGKVGTGKPLSFACRVRIAMPPCLRGDGQRASRVFESEKLATRLNST